MGKYEEKIYERAEMRFGSIEKQIEWLKSFGGMYGGNEYELAAVGVGEDLEQGLIIQEKAESAKSLEELNDLSKQANKLKFNRGETLGAINTRISDFEEEREQQIRSIEIQEESISEEERDIESDEQTEVQEIESEADEIIETGEIEASNVPTEEEKMIIRRQAQRESDRLRESRLREIRATSEDRRKRNNAKRQLLKIEKRRLQI
jgi:hypothetical protein